MSIKELLEALDGDGIIVEDYELIEKALKRMGLSYDTHIAQG